MGGSRGQRQSDRKGKPVRLLGLTGSIATGKSTAARLLAEAGVPVIDADLLARRVVEPGRPALREIAAAFGEAMIRADGSLDRPALGARIFGDEDARAHLNAIVHPRVEEEARREMSAIWDRDPDALVVYDVPLLFEGGMADRFDAVLVVYTSGAEQLRRLMARDRISEEDARTRIRSQMDIEEKASRADFVIDNMGSVEDLAHQLSELLKKLRRKGQLKG